MVREKEIVGIFDIENTTVSKITKEFINAISKKGQVINVSEDLPKSYVVCQGKAGLTVYISQISSATLNKRTNFLNNISNI